MVAAATILLAETTTKLIKMMIGALKVAIIKVIAKAEQEVVAMVIQVVVCVRVANSKVEEDEKILVSTNWSLSRYVCFKS
jgi:hypothetical protein